MNSSNFLKAAFSILVFCIGTFSVSAQSFYMQMSAGYNFNVLTPTHKDPLGTYKEINYGKGFTPVITFGGMFTKNIGAELNTGYFLGSKNKKSYTFQEFPGGNTKSAEVSNFSQMLLIQPAFVISGSSSGPNLYLKLGPVVGFSKLYEIYKEGSYERHTELRGSVAFGGQTMAGVSFNAGAKNSFFAEANLRLLKYSPTNGEVTKLLLSGKDHTDGMSVRGREVVFVKSPSNSYGNYDSPTQAPRVTHSLNSAGISIGFKHNF